MRPFMASALAVASLSFVACSQQGSTARDSSAVGTTSQRITSVKSMLKSPATIDAASLQSKLGAGHYERSQRLSATAKSDVHAHRAHSIPTFQGSYSLGGTTYPYTMIGDEPREGRTTHIKSTVLPVSLYFDEFGDANGNNLVLDSTSLVPLVTGSPDFVASDYTTGHTQFIDAEQRAEFWNVKGKNWHTILDAPRVQKTLTLEVPVGAAQLFQLPGSSQIITLIDPSYFGSQLTTLMQLADFNYDEIAILLTPNMFIADPSGGLVLGFHSAWDAKDPINGPADPGQAKYVQTFAWASWIDPSFGFGGGFSDVTAISHELSELANDPFVDNATEAWEFPGNVPGNCQSNLETGDPVEVTDNAGYPVTINGYTYHPQTEALLQWFTQEVPSSAFGGAYSFPDATALPGPSVNCIQPPPPPSDAGTAN
jgi:hypothetical protein